VTKSEIDKRLGQITFNAPLQKELEAIGMMKTLLRKEGEPTSRLGRKVDSLQLHHLSAEDHVDGLSQASVLNTDWDFLTHHGIGGVRQQRRGSRPKRAGARRTRGEVKPERALRSESCSRIQTEMSGTPSRPRSLCSRNTLDRSAPLFNEGSPFGQPYLVRGSGRR